MRVYNRKWARIWTALVIGLTFATVVVVIVSEAEAHRPYKDAWIQAEAKKSIHFWFCGAGRWRCLGIADVPYVHQGRHKEGWRTLGHTSYREGLGCVKVGPWLFCAKRRSWDTTGVFDHHTGRITYLNRR